MSAVILLSKAMVFGPVVERFLVAQIHINMTSQIAVLLANLHKITRIVHFAVFVIQRHIPGDGTALAGPSTGAS
jgi:hypothetical protein